MKLEPDKQVLDFLEEAEAIVEKFPTWKQGILEASSRSTRETERTKERVMTREQADCVQLMLDTALSGRWDQVRKEMVELGYTPDDIVSAAEALAEAAGTKPIICDKDFS